MSEMVNPYIAGGPVTERTMFFGRQDVFDWVQGSLAGKFVDHILVIHGQRRVGKTSVLKQIPFHLPPTYIPVFFDLQGRTRTSIDAFLWRLAKEITRTLRTTQGISLPEPSREDFSRDPEFFQNRFLPQLSQGIGERRLLLLFDEFDSLEEPTAREMLAQDLIPYFSRLMHAPGPLAFIFSIGSSGRKLEHMRASYTDFFRIALYRKISFLQKEEAFRLITQPVAGVIEYTAQAVEDIFQITSGHPYFTQLVCHELFGYCQKTGKRRVTPKDIEAVLGDVVERGMVNLKFVWDDASDPERYVLTALSLAEDVRDAQTIHEFLQEQKVRISPREVTDSLRHLQQKDVLASDNSFTVDLMRLWLLDSKPLDRVVEELMAVSPIAARYIEIAQEFHETGMRDKALESYRSALEIDPQNLVAQVGIASLIFEQGDLPQAVQEYQKALEIDPEDIAGRSGFCQTHLALGDQLRDEGRIEEAVKHYQQVLSVNEQHLEARERLAAYHAQQGTQLRERERFDEAIEAFERALEFTPDDRAITAQLAEAQAARRAKGLATLREIGEEHFRAERWEQAIASFAEYLSLEPEDEEAAQAVEARLAEARRQRELGEMYRQAQGALNEKRYGEAVGLLKEIINRDVSYKDATKLLARAVELQREARPFWRNIVVVGGAGGAIIVVIVAFFVFRFLLGGMGPTPAATHKATPTSTAKSVPSGDFLGDMIPIPAGEFTMGEGDEAHRVYLDTFYIGKYEVTNAQYQRFVETTGHRTPVLWPGGAIPGGKENHPVVNVSWHDAGAYCQWLSEQTGQVVRLPTEAEWEKAARGTDGRVYPWGNEFDKDKCNSIESGIGDTTPVDAYSPEGDSPYGVADMAGNVWEWTSSLDKAYPYDPEDGREDPEADGDRVVRGGAFHIIHRDVRCAFRSGDDPDDRSGDLGFRVVVSPGSP